MSHSLSRGQAVLLGLVVVAALVAGGYGVARIADKQGFWAETTEVTVGLAEAHDVAPGTPVRIRGVDAGQVVAVEYPDHDGPGAEVTVRMELQSRFASRLYADATARVHSAGVFGSKVIAIQPGDPAQGPLASGRLRGLKSFGVDEAVAELRDTASEVKKLAADAKATSVEARGLLSDVRQSDGTIAKLLKDDDLYQDLKSIAAETKGLVKRSDKAIDKVDAEMANLKGFVNDGRATLRSVRQGTDAIARLPIIRGYVQDANALLVRPAHTRSRMSYDARDLFQPGTAILTDGGRKHLDAVAIWLRGVENDDAEVVVVAFADPEDPNQTLGSALEVTKKQSEVVIEFLKEQGIHKLGWTSRRKMTPLGMGTTPSPVVEREPLPASNLQVLLFTPI